jgi:hypothetical protein
MWFGDLLRTRSKSKSMSKNEFLGLRAAISPNSTNSFRVPDMAYERVLKTILLNLATLLSEPLVEIMEISNPFTVRAQPPDLLVSGLTSILIYIVDDCCRTAV